MSGVPLRQGRKEGYWKPVLGHSMEQNEPEKQEHSAVVTADEPKETPASRRYVCERCGTEFVFRSPFCRMCGWPSESYEMHELRKASRLDFHALRRRLNLSTAALICFIASLGAISAAACVGF